MKVPCDNGIGWTTGTKHIQDLGMLGYPKVPWDYRIERDGQEKLSTFQIWGLLGCPMGSKGTMGQWDVPGHPMAKLNNPLK